MAPTRIASLLDFETYFGGDYQPESYVVELDSSEGYAVGAVIPRVVTSTPNPTDPSAEFRRYYLYGCLRHFYANGGGPCYIVSVGDYDDAPAIGSTTTLGLSPGLSALERFDEPTLLLFPDGVSLADATALGGLQVQALAQCETLQDRFVLMDLHQGNIAASISLDPVALFRDAIGTRYLKYGAAYYPWLQTIYRPPVHFRRLQFIDPSNSNSLITNLETLLGGTTPSEEDTRFNNLVTTTLQADAAVETVVTAVSSTANSSALTLSRDNFDELSVHFANLLESLRQTPATPISGVRQQFLNLLLLPRAIALAFQIIDTAATLPATTLPNELQQAIQNYQSDADLITAIVDLVALEKHADVMGAVSTTRVVDDVHADYSDLNGTPWIGSNATVVNIAASTAALGTTVREHALNAASRLQELFNELSTAMLSLFDVVDFLASEAEKQLLTNHPIMKAAVAQIQRTMSVLPSSGAMAGICAAVDRTRGVWKAPANVSVADVVGPAFKINDAEQADLNVHTTGKSINAIRAFTGKGTLVWGARTLAGNDNEWRYIPVRRFFNMAEESIKKATEPFVFEPNDANTWVRVRAMIENFLTLQWRTGALSGAKTEQAFYVKVGLGETMTAQDILEGRMIVEIGMAVVRPAEFIILKFAHKMQVS